MSGPSHELGKKPQVPGTEAGYEAGEPDLRPILYFLLGLGILTLLGLGASAWLESSFASGQDVVTPHPMESFRKPPTGPLLQATSGEDAALSKHAETQRLETYGWIDRPNGLVHVPIEIAIDRVLSRGLPVRTPQVEAQEEADE